MDINKIKSEEIDEILDFYYHVKDYGHIFLMKESALDGPFKKIMEGISEVKKMIEDSYGA